MPTYQYENLKKKNPIVLIAITYPLETFEETMVSRLFFVLFVGRLTAVANGLSSRSTSRLSASANSWSEADLLREKSKMMSLEDGITPPMPRNFRIRAELLDFTSVDFENVSDLVVSDDPKVAATKIVHFQRHGQGYHNLLGDVLRDAGVRPDIFSSDTAINPWVRSEIVDSPLTEKGKQQCRNQRKLAATLKPEVVIVSPLLRAIQTAKLSFADYSDNVPWMAHEGCREETGYLVCNKRRKLSEIQADFPDLKLAHDFTEEDSLFDPTKFESEQAKGDRVYDFLVNFLVKRPESNIAVVCHSAWLAHMCNEVMDCGDDSRLTKWFDVSEIRSMKLTFEEIEATN